MQIYKIETEENGRELTIHGNHDFPCGSYDERFSHFVSGEVPWHWHSEIEIVLVIEGATKVECLNSSDIVKTGEMIFINANTLHKLTNHSKEDCRILNVVFNPKMLGGVGYGLIYKKHVLPVINNKELLFYKFCGDKAWHKTAINELISAFDVWAEQGSDREFYMNIALMKFWHIFCTNQQDIIASQSTTKGHERRVQSLLNFIHSNYKERISIADISQAANISESECYRIFRNALSCSPNSYLLDYRLRRSVQLLTESNKKIADIAYEIGFNCSTYFAKKFKQAFNVTPMQFRKNYRLTLGKL
ncbi:AraC family transcriptional regulator [Marinomonas shanghaiensis]|uniref:AraC family transcriptional regulator n=1 Tax=Marinomonas shanghaiensis TaxID=2202418 RepID=UPI000DB8FA0C|nr:AraC family transcriptional regulator [Marinomonas shanghaiensis]